MDGRDGYYALPWTVAQDGGLIVSLEHGRAASTRLLGKYCSARKKESSITKRYTPTSGSRDKVIHDLLISNCKHVLSSAVFCVTASSSSLSTNACAMAFSYGEAGRSSSMLCGLICSAYFSSRAARSARLQWPHACGT